MKHKTAICIFPLIVVPLAGCMTPQARQNMLGILGAMSTVNQPQPISPYPSYPTVTPPDIGLDAQLRHQRWMQEREDAIQREISDKKTWAARWNHELQWRGYGVVIFWWTPGYPGKPIINEPGVPPSLPPKPGSAAYGEMTGQL